MLSLSAKSVAPIATIATITVTSSLANWSSSTHSNVANQASVIRPTDVLPSVGEHASGSLQTRPKVTIVSCVSASCSSSTPVVSTLVCAETSAVVSKPPSTSSGTVAGAVVNESMTNSSVTQCSQVNATACLVLNSSSFEDTIVSTVCPSACVTSNSAENTSTDSSTAVQTSVVMKTAVSELPYCLYCPPH